MMEGGDINKCPYYAAKMGKKCIPFTVFMKFCFLHFILQIESYKFGAQFDNSL